MRVRIGWVESLEGGQSWGEEEISYQSNLEVGK